MKLSYFQRAIIRMVGGGKLLNIGEATYSQREDASWTRLSGRGVKGLSLPARDRQLDMAFQLWLTNGLAKRVIEILNDYVCGDGFDFKVKSDVEGFDENKLKWMNKVVDDFWKVNKIRLFWEKKCTDLSVNGMLIQPTFVNEQNGSVKLGFIDPKNIDHVLFNPLNVEEVTGIKLKASALGVDKTFKAVTTLLDRDSLTDPAYGLMQGECFYWAINNLTNQPEGVSDLLASLDWIDVLDQMIFNVLDNTRLQNIYVQKVILKNKNEEQLKQWEKDHPFPTKPSRFVGNEDTEMELLSPKIQGSENAEIVRIIKNYALATFGYPEHWFADGGNTNLATATVQDAPVMKKMAKRQNYVSYILEQMATFALHMGYLKKRQFPGISATLDREDVLNAMVEIIKPELMQRDLKSASEALKEISATLAQAVNAKFISDETAGTIFRSIVSVIGYTVDDKSELAKIADEEAKK